MDSVVAARIVKGVTRSRSFMVIVRIPAAHVATVRGGVGKTDTLSVQRNT